MFKIEKEPTKTSLPIIKSNYKSLLYDEGSILFSGRNYLGTRILGSIADEDYELRKLRYFHILLSESDYTKFILKKTTYRELILQNANDIFVVDYPYDKSSYEIFRLNLNQIPNEYIPLEKSFCPDIPQKPSIQYSLRMIGKLANDHLIEITDLLKFDQNFPTIIRNGMKFLNGFGNTLTLYSQPRVAGSFILNYLIKIDDEKNPSCESDFFGTKQNIIRFLSTYMEYNFTKLCTELVRKRSIADLDVDSLMNEYNHLFSDFKKDTTSIEKLKNDLYENAKCIDAISTSIGTNFDQIEIYSGEIENADPIGIIDITNKSNLSIAIPEIESSDIKTYEANEFSIRIYQLNTDSRNGKALLKLNDEDQKIGFNISGKEKLSETKYSESLYFSQFITIKGTLKSQNGSYNLLIDFE